MPILDNMVICEDLLFIIGRFVNDVRYHRFKAKQVIHSIKNHNRLLIDIRKMFIPRESGFSVPTSLFMASVKYHIGNIAFFNQHQDLIHLSYIH